MKRCCLRLLLLLCLLCAFSFISCSTAKVECPDITNLVDPVLMQRPDNSQLTVVTGPILEMKDVVHNSSQYLMAWELWENYADSLEKTLIVVRDELK